jgi:hypothetical protein
MLFDHAAAPVVGPGIAQRAEDEVTTGTAGWEREMRRSFIAARGPGARTEHRDVEEVLLS